jgi:hypothetical protein
MLTGIANAQIGCTIASDTPSDPVYADGWQEGDNGGFGFTGWSFYGTYITPVLHALDSTSPYNHLGLAWTLYLANGNTPGNPSNGFGCDPNDSPNPPPGPCGTGPDLSRAGRGFAALTVGQTISVVVDNPTERKFYKGYTISLISGTNNVGYCCPAGIQRLRVGTFEYFTYGTWYTEKGFGSTGLTDLQTAAAGMRLDVTLTGVDTYSLKMTPLAHPELAYSESGTMTKGTGMPINWIMFEHYNTDSDFYDAAGPHLAPNPHATDLYISSMTITAPDTEAPLVTARPAPNPGGKNIPGKKQHGSNPNGFFQLLAKDDCDPNPKIYVKDSASSFVAGPFANGDLVKITTDPDATPEQKPMAGVVQTHIILNGTALVYATDASGNSSTPVPVL